LLVHIMLSIIQYQWRTQEFCSGGRFNKLSWGHRA
jgi:hypothetical protein